MQKRIVISILFSVFVVLTALWVISYLSVRDSINRSLENRLRLAQTVSSHIDSFLQSNLTRLYDISLSGAINFEDGNWGPELRALKTAYQYSIFTDGIFLLDKGGNKVLAYPSGRQGESLLEVSYVREALSSQKPIVTDVYTFQDTKRSVVYVLVPLRDGRGRFAGLAGGEINPTNYMLVNAIKTVSAGSQTVIELVDSRGTVIASNDPGRVLSCTDHDRFLSSLIAAKKTSVATCHKCHAENGHSKRTTEMLAFCPLESAPWGVSVREPEAIVFAPSRQLKKRFIFLGIISMGSSFILAIGLSNSIVSPIKSLITAARRIADGNLREPISTKSFDELSILSQSFETMRKKLHDSLERIRGYNEELERKVEERTAELRKNRKRLEMLLDAAINAQEEERKRVARELHDETSQLLAALGMSIEIAAIAHEEGTLTKEALLELKNKVGQAVDGLHMIIRDLRPPVLDDLGLESAIRWLLESHLENRGIKTSFVCSETFRQLMSQCRATCECEKAELMLFRIAQEAIRNIAKHSQATEAFVYLGHMGNSIIMEIEDNGAGFNAVELALPAFDTEYTESFGIMGMKERATLLGGTLKVCSRHGEGTLVSVNMPCKIAYEG